MNPIAQPIVKRRGIPSLTGIRGVAAIWVMLFHLSQGAAGELRLPGLAGHQLLIEGFRGVDLFFILSGFILMFAHERDFVAISKASLIRFAKLRFTRVYPLNTIVLLLIALLIAFQPGLMLWARATHNPQDFTIIPFIKTLFLANHWYLPGGGNGNWNTPTWSLSLEMLGYVAFPLVAHWASRVHRTGLVIAVILANYLAYLLALTLAHDVYKNAIQTVAIARMFFAFVIGIAVYRLFVLTESYAGKWATSIGVASLLVVFSVVIAPQTAPLMDLAFAALLYSLAFQRGWINAVIASPPVVFLGKISFPFYLIHTTLLLWVRYYSLQRAADWSLLQKVAIIAAWIAASTLGATILHYAVERPLCRGTAVSRLGAPLGKAGSIGPDRTAGRRPLVMNG